MYALTLIQILGCSFCVPLILNTKIMFVANGCRHAAVKVIHHIDSVLPMSTFNFECLDGTTP